MTAKTVNLTKIAGVEVDIADPYIRSVIRRTFFCWCLIYLPHYFTLTPADFHMELAYTLTDEQIEMLLILGFRGSAKSVIASLALPLFCALEKIYFFIILGGDTTTQTKLNIANIKEELETNALILLDYGLMFTASRNWSGSDLLLTNGVRILARSRGQKVRGLRHMQYRPQLIIIDDPEDLEWVGKKENRDKTERWIVSEVIPAQQETGCKLVLIGNLLHLDAIMTRMKKKTRADGSRLFTCFEIPLIDKSGDVTWKAKYPTQADIDKQMEKVGSASAWAREYLLKVIAEEDQIIKESDIHYYDADILDAVDHDGKAIVRINESAVGGDLAISEKQSADFSAMVGGFKVEWVDQGEHILIKPNVFSKRVDFAGFQKEALLFHMGMPAGNIMYLEDVSYQRAAIETLNLKKVPTRGIRPVKSKRARLEAISPFIKSGYVKFPRKGCEALLIQLMGFGVEEHDDMVDALVYLIFALINKDHTVTLGKIDQL